jgi:aspartyl/asparaginyl-tRNA synthetase
MSKTINPLHEPHFNSLIYYKDITFSDYFDALVDLRHGLRKTTDHFFEKYSAKHVDLFMFTESASSPTGPGSDSVPIALTLAGKHYFLTDSAQFGFEPLLLSNKHQMLYSYLPSMRGEDPDERHLNQFYHTECEMKGSIDDVIKLVESYVQHLASFMLETPSVDAMSLDPERTSAQLRHIVATTTLPQISFTEALDLLRKDGGARSLKQIPEGACITSEGEQRLSALLGFVTPYWIRNFPRDTVPFYQKPIDSDPDFVLNGDLIFPAAIKGAFGGEIIGCGERQSSSKGIRESLARQKVSGDQYEWYLALRDIPGYSTTSGFGLGVERFLAWALCKANIRDVAIYPRLKHERMCP